MSLIKQHEWVVVKRVSPDTIALLESFPSESSAYAYASLIHPQAPTCPLYLVRYRGNNQWTFKAYRNANQQRPLFKED